MIVSFGSATFYMSFTASTTSKASSRAAAATTIRNASIYDNPFLPLTRSG